MFQEVGILPTMVYFPFLSGKWWMFESLSGVLHLREDKGLPQEERSLRLGEGSVRLGQGVLVSEGMFA